MARDSAGLPCALLVLTNANPPVFPEPVVSVIIPAQLRAQWQGHSGLARRAIEAFPVDQLFMFGVAGVRPFAEMAMEFIRMGGSAATAEWVMDKTETPKIKQQLLVLWEAATISIDKWFAKIPIARFQEHEVAYGQEPNSIVRVLRYAIDNEVHYRGQAYVYLRSLGIEPPAFYDR